MSETPTPPARTRTPLGHPVLVGVSYGFGLLPAITWLLWPILFGSTSGEAFRTTFGLMVALPIIAFVCSFIGLLVFKKSMKLALSPAIILALLSGLFCYIIASSTIAP